MLRNVVILHLVLIRSCARLRLPNVLDSALDMNNHSQLENALSISMSSDTLVSRRCRRKKVSIMSKNIKFVLLARQTELKKLN